MNLRLVAKLLGIVSSLIGFAMSFCLIWAMPRFGQHTLLENSSEKFEYAGFLGLCASIAVSGLFAAVFFYFGRKEKGKLFVKEAMAVVGLSWILATLLGAFPFLFSGTFRGPSVRLFAPDQSPQISQSRLQIWGEWTDQEPLSEEGYEVVSKLLDAGVDGISKLQLERELGVSSLTAIRKIRRSSSHWRKALLIPSQERSEDIRENNFRIRFVKMGFFDSLFESQSGFSTTGATVISNLEDPRLVPHCILFWRSLSHFLGGLGIIVLFVVILGQGSAGKALMRAEMTGPTKEGKTARMQHTAWIFAVMYCLLNLVLAIIYSQLGMNTFDALCHAFGTMATGGFSTYNGSLGAFGKPAIEYVTIIFMILAGMNFTLLYLLVWKRSLAIFFDLEIRTYLSIIFGLTILIVIFGMWSNDFGFESYGRAIRDSLFQVTSIITTTGYGTNDFDQWNSFSRGALFALMFVGGCSGSTGGGMKVIRHVLFVKILRLEMEQAYRPRVVRPLRIGNESVDDQSLRRTILVYFCFVLILFVSSWLFVIMVEPDSTWGPFAHNKLIDSASAVASTLNNIGPGLGTVGASQNYGHFSGISKFLFVWLMMLGRLEIFSILALIFPGFWRD